MVVQNGNVTASSVSLLGCTTSAPILAVNGGRLKLRNVHVAATEFELSGVLADVKSNGKLDIEATLVS